MHEGVAYIKTLSAILQDRYKADFAQKLGINPSYIRLNNQSNIQKPSAIVQNNRHKDAWELALVKTVLEYPQFIDQILDVLDPSLLQFHSREFSLALKGQRDAPELMAIMVDENILSLQSEEELRAELVTFLTKHYERELKKVNMQNSISFEEKAFYIRKFRGKIAALKRGELAGV